MSQADEAFYRAVVRKEATGWQLAKYLPEEKSLPLLLDVVGRVYNVHLVETVLPDDGRTMIGWHPSVRIFQVLDGPSGGRSHRCLGFVYLDLYMRTSMFGRPTVAVPGAQVMCRSHAYVNMGLMAAPYGQKKLFASEEMVAIAHEMGHAVHMLCHPGTFDELADQPLDLLEMPSVLAETVALHPGSCLARTGGQRG